MFQATKKKKEEKREMKVKHVAYTSGDDWRCVIFPRFSRALAHPWHLPRFNGDRRGPKVESRTCGNFPVASGKFMFHF